MNLTKIEWTDFTWNPITGCNRECSYCYAKKMAFRLKGRSGYDINSPFKPTFHFSRLNEPLEKKKPCMIFTCSMGDFFDSEVKEDWREEVYKIINSTPQHTYQILTKQDIIEPKFRKNFPKNLWLGVTIDGTSNYWIKPLKTLEESSAKIKFISFEPILGDHFPEDLSFINWAIIGSQTGVGAREVNKKHVCRLVNIIDIYNIPLFVKPNIRKQLGQKSDLSWILREEIPKYLIP
jgi:protein gp37